MSGVGQQFLPLPKFSSENPYWKDPAETHSFLLPDYRPKLSAQDFLYASTWEIWRRDVHMANCVRVAVQRTVRINWYVGIRRQIRDILLKEKQSAKTA